MQWILIFSGSGRGANFSSDRAFLRPQNGASLLTSAAPAPLNRLRKLWQEGRPTFGAIATIPSIQTVQIMARSGLDWIIVGLEHGPIDLTSAHRIVTSTSGTPALP